MKRLFITLLVLILLMVGAGLALPFVFSSDTLRQEFSNRVSVISGMDITLGGPVSFSVFPDLGLVAKDVKLAANNGEFTASVAKIVSSVNLSALFSGKVEITGLSLLSPEITVVGVSKSKQANPTESDNQSDPFASAVTQLERLSLTKLLISDGKFVSKAADGSVSIVSDIDAELQAPSLDGQINLVLSGTRDGQKISLTATLAALRPILQRQPSGLSIALKMDPAPHPILADLSASGIVLLAKDGSYQISNGVFTSLGQPLRLDALYRPGARPYGVLSLQAKRVDLGVFQFKSGSTTAVQQQPAAKAVNAALDLRPLANFDANVTVKIDSLLMDGVTASNIDVRAELKNGTLDLSLGNVTVAKGSIATQLSADLNGNELVVRGNLKASAFGIADLAHLAAMEAPMTGSVGLNIGYAFRGISQNAIKNSFNMAGTVNLSNGKIVVPALSELGLGQAATTISGLNMEATIEHVQKPIDLKGRLVWNGEALTLGSRVSPQSFIQNGAGPLGFSVGSRMFDMNFNGNASLSGNAKGHLEFKTASLGKLLAWIGQGKNDGLKKLSYTGNISADTNSFSFNKARITLNNIAAAGSGSLNTNGKPTLTTNLSIGLLDIAALTGGGANSTENKNSANGSSASVPIDLSPLKGFDADIKLKARKLKYGKVSAGPVSTSLTVKGGIARLQLPNTPFYGGSVTADITADGSGKVPAIKIEAKLSGIDALPLFRDAAEFKKIEGKLNADIDISGTGQTTRQFAKSLKGNSKTNFANGAIRGVNIAKIYNNLTAILAGGLKENQTDKTTFTALGLSFLIDKGVASTSNIKLLGPLVRMDGAGKIDLGEETIDMRLNPQVVASVTGQGGKFDVNGVGIPLVIKGALSNPQVYPDLKNLLSNPQAALNTLSKLGLDIKGLGNGKIDINKIASEKLDLKKLGLENVDLTKLGGKDAKKQATNIMGDLVAKKLGADGNAETGKTANGTENIVGGLIGSLLNSGNQKPAEPDRDQVTSKEETIVVTGQIPIPTPNPRRQVADIAAPSIAPKTVQKKIVEQIAPKLKLPRNNEITKKSLDSLLENILR